mgnify:CR=1 FL=1
MSDNETPQEATPPPPAETKKPRTNGKKMTDKQKADLSKHMVKMKAGGMTLTEQRSHRMKMMGRMRKGETLNKAHKNVMKA